MGVVTDIVATYRQPRRVMRRLLSMGKREDRALAFVMAGCTVVFMSQWPILARQAHLEKQDLNMLLGAALLAWIILAPLLLYCLQRGIPDCTKLMFTSFFSTYQRKRISSRWNGGNTAFTLAICVYLSLD